MKVLFLDIDGVLVTDKSMLLPMVPLPQHSNGHLPFRRGFHQFDGNCVSRLNKIIQATGADIVVSSSWRIGFWEPGEFQVLINYLYYQGIEGNIIDMTGRDLNGTGRRGFEIQEWLDENPNVESMVIIDDGSDMEHLSPYLVCTSWENGIEDHHVKQAIDILKEKYTSK